MEGVFWRAGAACPGLRGDFRRPSTAAQGSNWYGEGPDGLAGKRIAGIDTPWKWRKNRLSGTEAITKIVQNCQESLGMIVRMDNWSSTLNLCLMEVLAMANDPLTRSGQTKSPYSCFLFP